MRVSAIFAVLASVAATAMAAEYPTTSDVPGSYAPTSYLPSSEAPTGVVPTGTGTPSGLPIPSGNSTSNSTFKPSPAPDGAGAALSPASFVGLAIAGVAVVAGIVAF